MEIVFFQWPFTSPSTRPCDPALSRPRKLRLARHNTPTLDGAAWLWWRSLAAGVERCVKILVTERQVNRDELDIAGRLERPAARLPCCRKDEEAKTLQQCRASSCKRNPRRRDDVKDAAGALQVRASFCAVATVLQLAQIFRSIESGSSN